MFMKRSLMLCLGSKGLKIVSVTGQELGIYFCDTP